MGAVGSFEGRAGRRMARSKCRHVCKHLSDRLVKVRGVGYDVEMFKCQCCHPIANVKHVRQSYYNPYIARVVGGKGVPIGTIDACRKGEFPISPSLSFSLCFHLS